jgi:8-oxo-dGTP diphosphatase
LNQDPIRTEFATEPAYLPRRAPLAEGGAFVERVALGELEGVVALYRVVIAERRRDPQRRERHLHLPHVRARLARVLAHGGLFGVRDGRGGWKAAFCVLDHPSALWAADVPAWYLEKLVVRDDDRVLEEALLTWLLRVAAAAGADYLRVHCAADAPVDLRFWQTRGFLPVRTVADRAGPLLLHERRLRALRTPGLAVRHLDAPFATAFTGALRATLLFVVRDGRILLIHKKRGHGAGRINGPGGKLDPGESPRACAIRETREELGIEATDVSWAGELRFQEVDGSRIHGFVYRAEHCIGEPVETEEAVPRWTSIDAIPWTRMWPDDRMWLPWLLRREVFRAAFLTRGRRIEAASLALGTFPEPEVEGQGEDGPVTHA